jgi:hypothetical protein
MKHFGSVLAPLLLCLLPPIVIQAQREKPVPVCTQAAFAAFKSLPKLEYECPDGLNDYDEKILKLPARVAGLRNLTRQLETFKDAAWWQADVNSLNACAIHHSVGELTADEKESWLSGDHVFDLLGNHEMRLALLADPCYQTGFAGAHAFLLYHHGGQVVVSQVLNGYFSRVDNSVGIDFAKSNGEQLIEITTANSMPPSLVYYYFAIDPATNKALPKKIFKTGNKLTNEIYSAMLMGEPKEFGLPKAAGELSIIRNGRLQPGFSAYEESERGRIDADGRKLRRIVYRWNGRVYTALQNRRH